MALIRADHEASSSNTSHSRCSYHVFLSFRGEETRNSFTDHLYSALVNAGFRTFRDEDELERGEGIRPELQKAIQQSRSSVIVISKDYASSGWCLDELVMILERKRTSDHVVLPIFYDIDPSHVRKQSGSIAIAFARHEKKQSLEKLNRWRAALTEVSDLAGMVLQNQADRHESKFIKKIVKVIEGKLCRIPLSVSPYLVGMQYQVENIISWLQDGSSDVSIYGISGIGGIGKTTIAQVVYNSFFRSFEGSSFLENIREVSEQPNGLVRLQQQLLADILKGRKVKVQSVSEGIIKIRDFISTKKVLLVLDDVDHLGQLDAVVGMRDCFCPGSKIIITTRHSGLLKASQVVKVHSVRTLNGAQSLELFSWHSFGQDHPVAGYVELSEGVVNHCGGLPLALQTLGSSLSGKTLDVWESALKKLNAIPNSEVLSKLRISYDSLQDDHDQNLFLHLACFFIGKDKDVVVKILDECDFYTIVGIQNLVDRCLVTINVNNVVSMHQMICDMGREIVRQESREPEKRSRLWHPKDSLKVLIREKKGSDTIEGLALNMYRYPVVLETNAFAGMHKLRLLQLGYVQLTGSCEELPKGLKWLCWLQFPLDSILISFPLESLVVLEMPCSSLRKLWRGTKHLPSLKILDLRHSHDLIKSGDFSLVPNLERLIFEDCSSLVDVHESVGNLEKLVYLNMRDCKSIVKLPKNICMLKVLETLIISGCSNLYEFPMEVGKMKYLKVLEADGISINRLVTTSGEAESWPGKSVDNFWACLSCTLVHLSLPHCNLSDDCFPSDAVNLYSLKSLDLSNNPICSLPDFVRGLKGLNSMLLWGCRDLKSLVRLPRVRTLDVHLCESLESVTFQSISCIPESIGLIAYKSQLVEIEYWFKLEAIEKVDLEMIKLLCLCNLESMERIWMHTPYNNAEVMMLPIQGLYEYGIFSTFLPTKGNDVPGQFSHTSKGSSRSMSFTVPAPLLPNQRIRGLNIFCVYANYDVDVRCIDPIIIRVNNKSKGLKWIYGPTCYGIPSSKDVVWLSHWKLGNRLEAGDEVTVTVFPFEPFQIKEWGFQVVHEQEGKISNQHKTTHPDDNDVIGKCCTDFSELYQVMPGTYFLCGGPMIYDRQSHVLQKGSVLFNHIIGDSDESAATKEAMRDRKNFCSRSGLVTITGAVSLICSPGRISKEGRNSQPKIKYTSLTQPKAPEMPESLGLAVTRDPDRPTPRNAVRSRSRSVTPAIPLSQRIWSVFRSLTRCSRSLESNARRP
ncbi:disease resistance protein RPV1 [Rosa chinensis]|uniref:disease resistance protein RPV1 n=1 Tax=Rosa chinensis TaxID=74649 RepID=UPI000D08D3F9|nr:disease resistance protein RPV1 [Rosa chinensis]